MSKWWNNEMGAAGATGYDDPWLAANSVLTPTSLMPGDQQPNLGLLPTAQSLGMSDDEFKKRVNVNQDGTWTVQSTEANRPKGFLGMMDSIFRSTVHGISGAMSSVDKGLRSTPVINSIYGAQRWLAKNLVYQPLDKMASGAYWLYSEGVSQPLTTSILQMGKTLEGGPSNLFSGEQWGNAYHRAEHISPGQALGNLGNVLGMDPVETFARASLFIPTGGMSLVQFQNRVDPKYTNENYLYDNNFWQQKNGWKYSIGTGLMDATASMALDPTIAGGKALKAVKGATRAVQVAQGLAEGLKAGPITIIKPRTAEELVGGDKFGQFAQWGIGKSPEEIRFALERGRGSRQSAFTSRDMSAQLADVLSNAKTVDDWRMAARFAMGDEAAFADLSQKSQSFALAYGKALDNRVNIMNADSIYQKSYGSLVDNNFTAKPIKPRTGFAKSSGGEITPPGGRSIDDRVKVDEQGRLFSQSPYVNRVSPQATEEIEDGAKPFQQLSFEGKGFKYEVKPIDPSLIPTSYYGNVEIPGLQQWKLGIKSSLDANKVQLQTLSRDNEWLSKIMGNNLTDPAAANPLFGSMKEARFAGVGRDVTKQAERRMVQYMGVQADEGFQSRLLQNGIYGATVRFIGKMGDRLPSGVIDHNSGDAAQRLTEYLKASPVDNDDAADLVKNYSRIASKTDSVKYIEDVVEPKLFEDFGKKYNMDLDTVQEMYNRYRQKSLQEMSTVRHPQQMFAAPIGAGEEAVRIDKLTDGTDIVASPILGTQLQYTSALPNLTKFDKFLSRNADNINGFRRAGMNVHDALDSFMDSFNTVFKLGSLLRVAYVTRNVGEETISQAAKFGAMAVMSNAAKGGSAILRNASPLGALMSKGGEAYRSVEVNRALPMVQEMKDNLAEHIDHIQDQVGRRTKAPAAFGGAAEIDDPEGLKYWQDRLDNAKAYLNEFSQYEDALLQHGIRQAKNLGEGTFVYRGQVIPEAFNPEYSAAIPRDQITSSDSYKTVFGRIESFLKEDMIRSGNFKALTPDDPNHLNSWDRAVNFQILQDEVGKRVVQDPTGQEALKFLRSPEGALYRKNLGLAGRDDPAEHIRRVSAMIDQYIPDSLHEQAARNGKINPEDFKNVPIDERPVVHGEELRQVMKDDRGTFRQFDRLNEKWFQGLPKMASDRLSWQPTYVRAHRAAMQDLIDLHMATESKLGNPVDFIDMDTMNKLMTKADATARQTMKEILYQPNRTNIGHALRYISPFFSAYTDSMARWGGLISESPDLVGKMAKVYNAPIAANLVTDRNGNRVDEDGNVNGKFVGMSDRVLSFQMNPLTKNMPESVKNMKINVGSMNVVTPGEPWWNPGFGPVVAIPADTVMRNYPESSKFLNWVNPYGTQAESTIGDIGRAITPSWAEDLYAAYDTDGQKYQDALMAAYRNQMIDYHQNGGKVPDWNRAEQEATNVFFLNALADGILPGKTRQSDKYQFYVDALKALRQEDASTANDKFMAKYGGDFKKYADALMFTASSTKSKTGVPSTIEGIMQDEKFKDLIQDNPELGGFIVGDTSKAGAFNQWALLNQKMEGDRTTISARDRIKQTAISAGWDSYVKIADAIRADMTQMGLTNLQQKGGEELSRLKSIAVMQIANMYPQWADDYTTTDRDAVPKRIAAFKDLVLDPRLANDPNRTDIAFMRAYLMKRDEMTDMLRQREASGGSGSISAKSNQDIAMAWANFRDAVGEKHTLFGNIMDRYLSRDGLQQSIIKISQGKQGSKRF